MASSKKGGNTVAVVNELAAPIASELSLDIWDIRFVKEGASWFLKVFIDREAGVTVDDCEAFSRRLSTALDEADPIDQAYYLEVSSAGIERELTKDAHFARYIGHQVLARLIRPLEDKRRELIGTLEGKEKNSITLWVGEERHTVELSDTAFVKLWENNDLGGLE